MPTIGDRIKLAREAKGLLQFQLARIIGVKSANVISNWEQNVSKPDANKMVKICQALDISLSYLLDYYGNEKASSLSDEAMQVAKDYWDLDYWGRKVVQSVISDEQERCREAAQKKPTSQPEDTSEIIYYITPGFMSTMSAGTGQPAGNEYPENYRLIKEPPRGTSYIAPISGNSMEPTYNDGDLVFVHAQEEICVGQIGVFFMDGQQWVKELGDGVLISHNPKYAPIPMHEGIRCQGLVLGVCDESYFE